MKCKYVISLFLCLHVIFCRAQYDPSLSHYFFLEPSYNAASVGKESKLNINAAYNIGMAGFQNNPNTMFAAADMPVYFARMYHGVGLQMMNDQIGAFRHQRLQAQYAAKFRMLGGMMSVGVQGGLLAESLDGSKIDLEDSSDPAFSSSQADGKTLDLGVGVYYVSKLFYAGISVQHLNSPLVELGETNEIKIDPTYYFTAGCNIKARNPFITIKPSVLVRTDMTGYRADLTSRLVYTNDKKMLYIGAGYSPTNSLSVYVGGSFHGAVLGYSYEYYTSGLSFTSGSHELFVGYQTDINFAKKGRNRHQSPRIL